MRTRFLALPLLVVLALAASGPAKGGAPLCVSSATLAASTESPGAFRVTRGGSSRTVRYPAPRSGATAPQYTINAFDAWYDADGKSTTPVDTLVVPVGSTVRWHLAAGIHTITNGKGSSDPEAGTRFDYLLDDTHPDWDSTFTEPDTIDFFCFFHEPFMTGRLVVSANAGVPGGGLPATLAFARNPAPNPSRGVLVFAVALPRSERVTIDVLDLAGRRIATIHRGELDAGERTFRWNETDASGAPVAAGVYALRVQTATKSLSRIFTVLR